MMKLRPCRHGQARLRQRGFQARDDDLILSLGIQVNENEIFMPDATAAYEIARLQWRIFSVRRNRFCGGVSRNEQVARLKRDIHQIERIRNRKIVVDGDVLLTGYRTSRRHQRGCLRRLRDRARLHRRRWRQP